MPLSKGLPHWAIDNWLLMILVWPLWLLVFQIAVLADFISVLVGLVVSPVLWIVKWKGSRK